jgi:hypothetical protein
VRCENAGIPVVLILLVTIGMSRRGEALVAESVPPMRRGQARADSDYPPCVDRNRNGRNSRAIGRICSQGYPAPHVNLQSAGNQKGRLDSRSADYPICLLVARLCGPVRAEILERELAFAIVERAPQIRQINWRSWGVGGASTRTALYSVWQLGHRNLVASVMLHLLKRLGRVLINRD